MYDDLARLFIKHHDIRWANVLSTLPVSEGGLPGLPSPFTQRTYNLRIIDFDQSKKKDYSGHAITEATATVLFVVHRMATSSSTHTEHQLLQHVHNTCGDGPTNPT